MRFLLTAVLVLLPIGLLAQRAGVDREQVYKIQRHFVQKASEGVPLDTLEAIMREWAATDTSAVEPYVALANEHLLRDTLRARTRELVLLALRKTNYDVLEGSAQAARYLSYADVIVYFLAILDYKEANYDAALRYIHRAIVLADVDVHPKFYMRAGQIYSKLDSIAQAEKMYFRAYLNAVPGAKDSLLALAGSEGSFSELAATLAATELEPAKEFTGRDLDGNEVRLSDYRGKVVALVFWFVGCPGCVAEDSALALLTRETDPGEVALISIATTDSAEVRQYLAGELYKGLGEDFYHLHIPGAREISHEYGVSAFPTHVIIDRQGRVTARSTGGTNDKDQTLRPMIEAAKQL